MAASSKFITAIVAPVAAAILSGTAGDAAHKALVWSSIYLAIKCASELLMLVWQSIGMPDKEGAPAVR
jgi:hypothetical protein